jgi:hypothetical protein
MNTYTLLWNHKNSTNTFDTGAFRGSFSVFDVSSSCEIVTKEMFGFSLGLRFVFVDIEKKDTKITTINQEKLKKRYILTQQ